MCNFEHTTRPSPMMWPCMHTKGGRSRLVNENLGLRHMNGRHPTQLSIAITPSLLLEPGVWRTVSRFQIPLGLCASLTSRVSRQRSDFAQGAPTWTQERQGRTGLNRLEQSQTTHLLASLLWPWLTMANSTYSVFQDLSNLAATPGPGSLSNQALA